MNYSSLPQTTQLQLSWIESRESFLWWMKWIFSAVFLCSEYFGEFSIPPWFFFLLSFLIVASSFPSTSTLPKRSKVGIASTWNPVTVETSAYSAGHAGPHWGTLGLLQHHISLERRRYKSQVNKNRTKKKELLGEPRTAAGLPRLTAQRVPYSCSSVMEEASQSASSLTSHCCLTQGREVSSYSIRYEMYFPIMISGPFWF